MNILFITRKIFPLDSGDALHTYGFIQALANLYPLYVISLHDFDFDKNVENTSEYIALKNIVVDIKLVPQKKDEIFEANISDQQTLNKIANWLANKLPRVYTLFFVTKYFEQYYRKAQALAIDECLNSTKIDVIIFDHLRICKLFLRLQKKYRDIKFILNQHNVEFLNELETIKINRLSEKYGFWTYLNYLKLKMDEKRIMKKADEVFVISKSDAQKFCKQFKLKKNLVVNKPLIEFNTVKNEKDLMTFHKRLLILGSMNWYANPPGIIWFIEEVFSKIIAQDPEYKLFLVGSNPHETIIKASKPYCQNIIITGRVEDTSVYYKDCDISIIPTFYGTGVKIKVLESLARGIPSLLTSHCAADYSINDEAIICDTSGEFLDAIRRLEKDSDLRIRLFRNSQKYYQEYMKLSDGIIHAINALGKASVRV